MSLPPTCFPHTSTKGIRSFDFSALSFQLHDPVTCDDVRLRSREGPYAEAVLFLILVCRPEVAAYQVRLWKRGRREEAGASVHLREMCRSVWGQVCPQRFEAGQEALGKVPLGSGTDREKCVKEVSAGFRSPFPALPTTTSPLRPLLTEDSALPFQNDSSALGAFPGKWSFSFPFTDAGW